MELAVTRPAKMYELTDAFCNWAQTGIAYGIV